MTRFALLLAASFIFSCSSDDDGTGGSGGSSSGGAASGGTASGGTSSGGSGSGECETATDCALFGDCCSCEAQVVGSAPPISECPLDSCIQSHCDAISAGPDPQCVRGQCVLMIDCDLSSIQCRQAEPDCGEGSVPTALNDCYGGCVPITECPNPPASL